MIKLAESGSRIIHLTREYGNPALPSLGVNIIMFRGMPLHLFFSFRVDCREDAADTDFFRGVLCESSDSSAQLTISG